MTLGKLLGNNAQFFLFDFLNIQGSNFTQNR